MSHPGIVQPYINVKEQAEDNTVNQLQLQQFISLAISE